MLHGRFESIYLKPAFNAYIKQLIMYFKEIDKKDIIQEDYNLLDITKDVSYQSIDIHNIEKIHTDNLIMRDLNIKKITLDDFVVASNNDTSQEKQILPIKKDINLRDPNLRTKGLKKKLSDNNNINK